MVVDAFAVPLDKVASAPPNAAVSGSDRAGAPAIAGMVVDAFAAPLDRVARAPPNAAASGPDRAGAPAIWTPSPIVPTSALPE